MDSILNAVDLESVVTWITAAGLTIVGAALAFKGIDLAKRGVKKA